MEMMSFSSTQPPRRKTQHIIRSQLGARDRVCGVNPDLADVIPLSAGSGFRYSFPSRFPFPVYLDTLSNAERGHLADQREWQRLLQRKLNRPFRRGKFRQILYEGAHCRRRGIEADVVLERGEGDQYPAIGKCGHTPLQAFLGAGCRFANTRTHLTQFLLSRVGGGSDVLGDGFRTRLFWSHEFILSTLRLILQSPLLGASWRLPTRMPRQTRRWKSLV